jgi:hypothetical protein
MAPRSLLCAAKQPAYRTWCPRGGSTHAANFSTSSNGDSLMPVVPSDQGWRPQGGRAAWFGSFLSGGWMSDSHSWYWSRRINEEHRIVYKVDADSLLISQLRYYY